MNATVASAYMIGAIVFVVCMLLAIVSANAIRYEAGSNPKDKQKRKTCFWILTILALWQSWQYAISLSIATSAYLLARTLTSQRWASLQQCSSLLTLFAVSYSARCSLTVSSLVGSNRVSQFY